MLPEWALWVFGIAGVVGAIAGVGALFVAGRNRTMINEVKQEVKSSILPLTAGRDIQTVNYNFLPPPSSGVILGQDPSAEAAWTTTGSSGIAPEDSS